MFQSLRFSICFVLSVWPDRFQKQLMLNAFKYSGAELVDFYEKNHYTVAEALH